MVDKINEWLDKSLLDNSGTRKIYRCHINRYMKTNNQDANTYFNKSQSYQEHIKKYWEYLKGKSPNTRRNGISAIKHFLARFDRTTKNLDIWDDITARLKGTTSVPIIPKHVPEIDEIKIILQHCDIRCKTAIMMSITSGMRIGEVCNIEFNDIYLDQKPTKINIRSEIAKNKRRRITYISPEATELLKEWLRYRDEYTKNSNIRRNFKQRQNKIDLENDKRIFPVHENNIRRHFNIACAKAGFTKKHSVKGDFDYKIKRNRRELTFHNLRSFFRTYLGNVDLAEHLMGHAGYLSTYRQFNDKQLANLYEKCLPNITVFERPPDLTDINEKLAEKDQKIKELENKINDINQTMLRLLAENQLKNK